MKKIFYIVAVILMLVCLLSTVSIEEQIPPLIRLHVLANSDSARDQELKLLVRDQIISMMKEKFADSKNLAESREIVLACLPLIEEVAEKTLLTEGCNYTVQALYGQYDFPIRNYGGFILPAGKYEAVRVVIGEGEGANWWCVLFPPLCLVNGKTIDTEENEDIEEIVENISKDKKIKIKPAFKVVELWQEMKSKRNASEE
ncbi:MAG: stage II sporulation protein R [Peptococcia bacterium]